MLSISLSVRASGGGIGGLAAALTRQGLPVKVLEQSAQLGEIGAGIQFSPNAFAAFDAIGVGPQARSRAVCSEHGVMHDALDDYRVGPIPAGEAFSERFGKPYAERMVRNDLWKGRTPQRVYDAMAWLYRWTVPNCLAA